MNFNNIPEYEVIINKEISDINSQGYLLRHKKTGAKVMCLENDDINKVFYIGFRTPPEDSTGVPHIIEHSVLCGSEKYPAKDPFVELAKGSLNTFLNAMTYPDKTVYPVASCNDQDFKNLCDVYLDAVFHPNIYSRPQIFKQEGWHYELNDPSEDIAVNGVVYSEMKGAFSSADDYFDRIILDSLFPDTCYGVESGGDPDVIPSLTYEQFLDFHRRYYHPSNSYIYLYGDMDMEERLKYIDSEYLSKYDELSIDSSVKLQKAFDDTAYVYKEYPVTNDEPLEDNTYLSYNSVISTSLDDILYLAFQVIEYALISTPGAPLKKALLDSGICKDVQSTYDNGVYQPYFSIVIKNSNEKDKEAFIDTIKDVLTAVVQDGFDTKSLLAGINYFEFKFREADFGHYPKGLMYGLQTLDSWLYDNESAFIHLEQLHIFEYLKNQVNTGYFEELVAKYLLNNSHKSVVIMTPKRGLSAQRDKELCDKLALYKSSLSDEEINSLVEDTKLLHEYQESEDDKEVLETIPLLELDDIKKEAEPYIYEEHKINGNTLITHDIFTNGIGYLNIGFDISNMQRELIPYVGILKAVLGYVDTQNYSYSDLANEIFLNSGGVVAGTDINVDAEDKSVYVHAFELKAKVLYDKLEFAYDIIKEIIYTSKLDDKKRLYEIICMLKSRLSSSLVSSGHAYSSQRALSHIQIADAISEAISGIEFYRVIEDIERDFDNKADELIDNLKKIVGMIFAKDNLLYFDYTATKDQYEKFFGLSEEFATSLPDTAIEMGGFDFAPENVSEAFKTSAKVCYVSKSGKYIDLDHPYTGSLRVLKVIMGYDYLWNQVRVVGGAYGAFAKYYKSGGACYSSYRDPNLSRTLEVYDNTVSYLREFDASERDMTKYIIGTVADLDVPLTPSQAGARGLDAYLSHSKFEKLQKERDEILGTTADSIRKLSEYAENIISNGSSVCVIGGEEMIEDNKELFDMIVPLFN